MKLTIGKSFTVANLIGVIFLAVLAFAAHPGLVAAEEPYQLAQAKERIAAINRDIGPKEAQIIQWADWIDQWNRMMGAWDNWVKRGMRSQFNNDPQRLAAYRNNPSYKATVDAFFAGQQQQADQIIQQGRTQIPRLQAAIAQRQAEIAPLQAERAQYQWLVQTWYSPGGSGSSSGATQSTTGTPSTGSGGSPGGPGLLGVGMGGR